MKLYVQNDKTMSMIAEGPRSKLGPLMQRLKQEQGIRSALYDNSGNFVSSTI